jgi:endonuclease/exonuclease/phosphatase (EEP) superfamily protein YafD
MQKNSTKLKSNFICAVFCSLSFILLIILFNPFNNYYFYIIQSFAYQLICLLFVILVITIILKNKTAIIFMSVISLIFIFYIASFFQNPINFKSADNKGLLILQMNIHYQNKNIEDILKLIERENPDILSLQELSVDTYEILEPDLDKLFAYNYVKPENSPFGLVVFSKIPFNKSESINIYDNQVFFIQIEEEKKLVNLVVLHAWAPLDYEHWNIQNKYFKKLNNIIKEKTKSAIIIGDLNSVPWHKELSAIIRDNHLKTAYYSPFGTYPVGYSLFQVPIDHIIVSNSLNIIKTEKVRIKGSDHLGIKTYIQIN